MDSNLKIVKEKAEDFSDSSVSMLTPLSQPQVVIKNLKSQKSIKMALSQNLLNRINRQQEPDTART